MSVDWAHWGGLLGHLLRFRLHPRIAVTCCPHPARLRRFRTDHQGSVHRRSSSLWRFNPL